jgi:hypothetical protein
MGELRTGGRPCYDDSVVRCLSAISVPLNATLWWVPGLFYVNGGFDPYRDLKWNLEQDDGACQQPGYNPVALAT